MPHYYPSRSLARNFWILFLLLPVLHPELYRSIGVKTSSKKLSEYFFFKISPPKIVIFLQGIPQAFFLNSYPLRLSQRNRLNSRHSSRYIFWIIFQGLPPRYFLLLQGLLWHNIALASTFWIYYRIYFYFMFVCDDRAFNIRGFGQILKLDA